MARFRELGRDAFIAEHSAPGVVLLRSRDFFVLEGRIGYNSMPLMAAAYGLQHGRKRGLHSDNISGDAGHQMHKRVRLFNVFGRAWSMPQGGGVYVGWQSLRSSSERPAKEMKRLSRLHEQTTDFRTR